MPEAGTIVLINTRPQTFVANMFHGDVCRRAGKCFCVHTEARSSAGKRVVVKSPSGFHVFGRKASDPLPEAVLGLAVVRAALEVGWLKLEEPKASAPAPVLKSRVKKGA